MSNPYFLAGGGAVGALMRAHPWSATPLGEPHGWPAALKTLVQLMLASSQPMFIVWGPHRTYLYNDVYTSILGLKHPAALGRDFLDAWYEIRNDIAPLVARAYAGEAVQMDDIALVLHRKGHPEEAHFSFSYSPILGDDGQVAGFFCAVSERTNEVLVLRELRASEARYRRVLSNMDEGFVLMDRGFRVTDINDYALRLSGREREEMVGRSHWELFPGSEELEIGRLYIRAMADGTPGTLEHLYAWPDGRETWIDVRAYPTVDGLAVFFRDVTARHEVAQQAAESAERVQLALEAGAIVGTWVWDPQADRLVADERFARAFGLDAEDCRTGLPVDRIFESIHPDERDRVRQATDRALRQGGNYRCDYRVLQHDGRYHLIEASGRCELDAGGRPIRFPGVLLDIEDRRQAERERDQATAMLRTFIEAVPGVVYAKDLQGRMLLANKGTAQLIGKPPEFFIGKTDAEFLQDQELAHAVMANDRRIMASGQAQQFEEKVPLPDGTPAYWLSTKAPLFDATGQVVGLIGASVDISERKREQERAQSEAEMLDLLNQTAALLAGELDLEVLLQRVTDAATKLTGARFGAFFYNGRDAQGDAYMLFTLSGAPRSAFEKFGHPRATPVFEPTFRGGPPIRLHDVLQDPRYGRLGPHHGMPQGHLPVRSYLAVSVLSRGGDVVGGLFLGHPEPGVFSDRSERLAVGVASQAGVAIDNARLYAQAQRAAQERTQLLESERAARAEAERASKLKDEFLATLSHELRTPLSAMLGWAHILRRKVGSDPAVAKGIDVIERSTRVQTQLIEDLLDMSRITSGKLRLDLQPMHPIVFVQAAIDSIRPLAETSRVKVALTVAETVPAVLVDGARMQQVVWNLLSNAVKFSPAGSEVSVLLGGDDRLATIEVQDRGVGIAPEFLPHVFERFRQADGSTTRKFGGLGLGLAIVRHLGELHGGTVRAHSPGEGLGATFTVVLPAHVGATLPVAPAAPILSDDVALQGVTVLVVDDEPDVLELLARVLGDAGAHVVAVASAQQALEALTREPPRLLISDIGMAGMDGYELMRRVRRAADASVAGIPAIALTAFARPEDRERALGAGFNLYLSKPVEPHELVRRVYDLAQPPRVAAS
ncbi:MAG TPA: PAS domain-containing protein [Ramlibacter sp.]|jgi:PAS domain S-box-containing protein|uniref:PAS domain-containing protein n=1 Tax=Ramlibacter sp. TaxID=1917967 RepID=UPI002D36C913|nr:PAS domain-containing protein [Ramlibacter sp.]HZY17825.1 PAS domain-containing protein [Ramlibacter sp.]